MASAPLYNKGLVNMKKGVRDGIPMKSLRRFVAHKDRKKKKVEEENWKRKLQKKVEKQIEKES